MALLDHIDSPQDLSSLSFPELKALAREIRQRIIEVVERNGGHLSSNLGVVELTMALHRVFSTPRDAIVWDVGHQCYAHKLLTGRRGRFDGLRRAGGISGFPRRAESPHDAFDTGHSSTSISAALGILEAKRRLGAGGKAIAVIGDGAMTAGMAFEALSHAGTLARDLIVVLNDNKMSISPNVGAFSLYLSRLTATTGYQRFRDTVDKVVLSLPGGRHVYAAYTRMKRAMKAAVFKGNLFCELGFEYIGPVDGHDLRELSAVFHEARRLSRPVLVHVVTRKGKGLVLAEDNPTAYHGVSPVKVTDGKVEAKAPLSYTEAFSDALIKAAAADERIVAITAAMEKGTGLSAFHARWPERFYDVGIAEQHAVTFAAGMASAGLKPVVAMYSTFLQRAWDQLVHDVALQGLPVVFCLDRAGPVGDDGQTHQGLYDIPAIRCVPNMALLSPASAAELSLMLDWALASGRPVAIRYPKTALGEEWAECSLPLEEGRGVFIGGKERAEVLLVSHGGLVQEAEAAREALAVSGIMANHYALRFLKPLDEEAFLAAAEGHRAVLFAEEGAAMGGLGERLGMLLCRRFPSVKFRALGAADCAYPQMSRRELLDAMGMSRNAIMKAAADLLSDASLFRVRAG